MIHVKIFPKISKIKLANFFLVTYSLLRNNNCIAWSSLLQSMPERKHVLFVTAKTGGKK